MRKSFYVSVILFSCIVTFSVSAQDIWKPVGNVLTTSFSKALTAQNVLPEYPRPQMTRDHWQNLNGLWDYAVTNEIAKYYPLHRDGVILVPFGIESSLSGVKKTLDPDQKLWYKRTFAIPANWKDQKILLHFGAVDWKAEVWVNDIKVGDHVGGYTPFTFDITKALKKTGEQRIVVSAWDPTDKGFQPIGKQTLNPRGIWYTSTSGIWQTVWLEPVPEVSIAGLKVVPDIDKKTVSVRVDASEERSGYTTEIKIYENGKEVTKANGKAGDNLVLNLAKVNLWSPDNPFLYDLKVSILKNGKKVDEVKSYFGMRKIALGKDAEGITRLFLNNEPVFQFGPLDQGFWPDGIYTAPTDEALKFDIIKTKNWGFNMIRKHVKVEPARWYYYCDSIGILVWQDMPSGDKHISPKDEDIQRIAQSSHNYKGELRDMISALYNHPSIVTWVPFNEGWGQFQTKEIAALIKQLDPSRLVDATTGWADRGVGDMHDMHKYPGPGMFPVEDNRASVLGEFGGQALVVPDHLWITDFSKAPTHYKTSTSPDALHQKYETMMDTLKVLKAKGLSAAVYTQTTDVESEVNGLMTYDRKVVKFDEKKLKAMNQSVIKDK